MKNGTSISALLLGRVKNAMMFIYSSCRYTDRLNLSCEGILFIIEGKFLGLLVHVLAVKNGKQYSDNGRYKIFLNAMQLVIFLQSSRNNEFENTMCCRLSIY